MKTCLRKEFTQKLEDNTEKNWVTDCNKYVKKENKIVNIKHGITKMLKYCTSYTYTNIAIFAIFTYLGILVFGVLN